MTFLHRFVSLRRFMMNRRRALASRTALLALSMAQCAVSAIACDITPAQFQQEALAFLSHEYPERKFLPGTTSDVVLLGKAELGLQNLRSKLCLSDPAPDLRARQVAMKAHFSAMMQLLDAHEQKMPQAWQEARALVYPQLMSSDYVRLFQGAPGPIVRPFVPGVQLGVVLDRPNGYAYVREEDRKRWSVDTATLYETALKNLDRNKGQAKLQGGRDADRFLGVEEKDGYDAVRLLIPWVRQEAAKLLGDPFLANIPNRDFLIMWSSSNSPRFQQLARTKVQADFKQQPYPLTPATLRVWADGRIEAVP